MSDQKPEFAKTYKFESGAGNFPTIDGKPIPWWIDRQGPLVESLGDGRAHLLWLPVLIDAPMPTPPEGHPDGEPLA